MVARGLTFPTDFARLPDGRLLVTQKDGLVRVVKDGRVLAQPFLDLRARAATKAYQGIMAIEAAPDFQQSGLVYVLYVQRAAEPKGELPATTERLISVVAKGDEAVPDSERVILGAGGRGTPCPAPPGDTDCLPADGDHDGGDIEFARDGSMFVTTGDGDGADTDIRTSLRAQNIDTLAGKVLHLTREGKGIASNPFWNGDGTTNRSKVWAYGLRNPFRFTLRGGVDAPYVGDVGFNTYEEIDAVRRGANLGWPCYEGPRRAPEFAAFPVCKSLYRSGSTAVQRPSFSMGRKVARSMTGGVFYTGDRFPITYRGAYFFGDWELSTLRTLRFDESGMAVGRSTLFGRPAAGPVKFLVHDGDLYYLALNAGEVRRVRYTGN